MHDEEIRRVLDQVTQEILERMRRAGFYYRKRVRYDPTVWDINNGHCEAWAFRAAELIPGSFAAWIDTQHCVLIYNGRFYDADCPQGTQNWEELPMFADPPTGRPEP